jgi:hypothetical protein
VSGAPPQVESSIFPRTGGGRRGPPEHRACRAARTAQAQPIGTRLTAWLPIRFPRRHTGAKIDDLVLQHKHFCKAYPQSVKPRRADLMRSGGPQRAPQSTAGSSAARSVHTARSVHKITSAACIEAQHLPLGANFAF